MTTYTVLADGKTRSTAELDARFEDAQNMPTKDACGRPNDLLLAQQAEAFGNAFSALHRDFGEGNGSAGEWFATAAKYYEKHAQTMMEIARSHWRRN